MNKRATIRREVVVLKTYPFSDPSPMPQFGRLYPYNRFDGYAFEGRPQEWEMIILENEWIKLWINPAVGGKIWGAVEKQGGQDFIYFNQVAKFRDVAMRGPWTSGGIETNTGIIGHAPSCSAPVDYALREHEDGSVSCFTGATDWSSRTTWRVEVCLPADKAYFITRTSLYNGQPLEQSYYQWTNAAVKTSGGLEYIFPGHKRIGHDGQMENWPDSLKDGNLALYTNNQGEYKSYHVFGSLSPFWGCYWHQHHFGMGHWSNYRDKPGKKIWIWGLSRYGMIWEDLLTDNNGQYTEVQSGRAFNQGISASAATPFKHRSFPPAASDSWDEYWFPVKETGGLTAAVPRFSFYVEEGTIRKLHLCANQHLQGDLILTDGVRRQTIRVLLNTLETGTYELDPGVDMTRLRLCMEGETVYDAVLHTAPLSRPSSLDPGFNFASVQGLFLQAKEWERQRFFDLADEYYQACLHEDPFFLPALAGFAGLLIRQLSYEEALRLLQRALSVDAYHPEANFLYGLAQQRLGHQADARDGFSIAALSPAYRAAAVTELAREELKEKDVVKARSELQRILLQHPDHKDAARLLVFTERLSGNTAAALSGANQLLAGDPLDHLARFELYRLQELDAQTFQSGISSELPQETYIELASSYYRVSAYEDALAVLTLAPQHAMVSLWQGYVFSCLGREAEAEAMLEKASLEDPMLVFPHREEEDIMLAWAVAHHPSWVFRYYLALCHARHGRKPEALLLMEESGEASPFYPFYLLRASLRKGAEQHPEADLQHAYQLAPAAWRTGYALAACYLEQAQWGEALKLSRTLAAAHPRNYYIGLQLSKAFLKNELYDDGIRHLYSLQVLPNEGASEGRTLWRELHLGKAFQLIEDGNRVGAVYYLAEARCWPENLGLGKPLHVDERLEDFTEMYCIEPADHRYQVLYEGILHYRNFFPDAPLRSSDILTLCLLRQGGETAGMEALLARWQHDEPGALPLQWVNAWINSDHATLIGLDRIEIPVREAMPYEIIVEDREYPFIKKLYKAGVLPFFP